MGSMPMENYYAKLLCFILICFSPFICHSQDLKSCGFDAIYQFGDSISDTGNAFAEVPQAIYGKPPYGETIHKTTGRASDGYLIIDYMALSAGLPLLEPYENPRSIFTNGVDFSVAGVTALPVATLAGELHLTRLPFSSTTLDVQIQSFKKHLSTICNNPPECKEKLKSALFVVGTISTNDYVYAVMSNRSIDEIKRTMVPLTLQKIEAAIQEVITDGAVRVLVPGDFPLGCTPGLLTFVDQTDKSAVYDQRGCFKDLNDFFQYHNDQLQLLLQTLRLRNPNVRIVYGDYYQALMWILDNLANLGFQTFLQNCCGTGGKYNFSLDRNKSCGIPGVPACPNPSQHVFWDGVHNTHQANGLLAQWLIRSILPQLQCNA